MVSNVEPYLTPEPEIPTVLHNSEQTQQTFREKRYKENRNDAMYSQRQIKYIQHVNQKS